MILVGIRDVIAREGECEAVGLAGEMGVRLQAELGPGCDGVERGIKSEAARLGAEARLARFIDCNSSS